MVVLTRIVAIVPFAPVSRTCTTRDGLRRACALVALEVASAVTVAVAVAFAFRASG